MILEYHHYNNKYNIYKVYYNNNKVRWWDYITQIKTIFSKIYNKKYMIYNVNFNIRSNNHKIKVSNNI